MLHVVIRKITRYIEEQIKVYLVELEYYKME